MLRRRTFFQGRGTRGEDVTDIVWFDADGKEMTDATWNAPHVRCLGVILVGDAIAEVDDRGEPIHDDTLLVLLNAGETAVTFTLPAAPVGQAWELVLDTDGGSREPEAGVSAPVYELGGRSLAVLRLN